MASTIIQSVREWLNDCPFLGFIAGDIQVDWLEINPTNHGIYPAGQQLIRTDFAGNRTYQYNAVIQISEFTVEDLNRVSNAGDMERLQQWVDAFNRYGFDLPEGCYFIGVQAGNGILETVDEDGQKGIYRIQINLEYEREI